MDIGSFFALIGALISSNIAVAFSLLLILCVVGLGQETKRLNRIIAEKDRAAQANISEYTALFRETFDELFAEGRANRESYSEALQLFERLTNEVIRKLK